jgi:pilus assembly protein CpaE
MMVEPVPISKEYDLETEFSLKTNINIWVLYINDSFRNHITSELSRSRNIRIEVMKVGAISEDSLSSMNSPDVIIVEARDHWAEKILEFQHYNLPFGDMQASLIVFGDENDTASLRLALKLGASDYLSDKATLNELFPLLKNISEDMLVSRDLGELLFFVNTKGGNGATTIAMNVAIDLADKFPDQVLLIDIDTQFGLMSEYLNLEPKYSFCDILDCVSDLDETSLSSMVTKYDKNLHTISIFRGQNSDLMKNSDKIYELISLLRQFYKYVVVDFSRGIDPIFSAVLPSSTKFFLVIQQNYMSLKNANQIVKELKFDFGLPIDLIELVVNRYDKNQPISLKDIKKTLPNVTSHIVPNDFKVANESANLGKPIIHYKKKSIISKSVIKLTSTLIPDSENSKGWFSRLFN